MAVLSPNPQKNREKRGIFMKYILKQDGCVPFEVTEDEYNEFIEIIKENRKQRVRTEIMLLANSIGSANAKSAVRAILRELED